MANRIEIDVWQGDLADLEVDAIIVPANESLFMTAGVAATLKRRAGEAVERAAVALGPVPPGQAVVTIGGELATPYLIHTVAVGHDLRADRPTLRAAVGAALDRAAELHARRIAMPPVGTERGVFEVSEVVQTIFDELAGREGRTDAPESVVIAVARPAEFRAVEAALRMARPAAP